MASNATITRAIVRQMRIRGWRPIHLPPADPLTDGIGRSCVWTSRDGLDRLEWYGPSRSLTWSTGGVCRFLCHNLDAETAGQVLEAYGLLRHGTVENAEWYARPLRKQLAVVAA